VGTSEVLGAGEEGEQLLANVRPSDVDGANEGEEEISAMSVNLVMGRLRAAAVLALVASALDDDVRLPLFASLLDDSVRQVPSPMLRRSGRGTNAGKGPSGTMTLRSTPAGARRRMTRLLLLWTEESPMPFHTSYRSSGGCRRPPPRADSRALLPMARPWAPPPPASHAADRRPRASA
jgi:hypothetical protein